jgi:hypothetical protein
LWKLHCWVVVQAIVNQVGRRLILRHFVGSLGRHGHHGHLATPTASTAAPPGSEIACSSEGAPIHALFPTAHPVLALPKALTIPFVLALAAVVPSATPIFPYNVGVPAPPAAGASSPRKIPPSPTNQAAMPNLTLSDVLGGDSAPASALTLTGDEPLPPASVLTVAREQPTADAGPSNVSAELLTAPLDVPEPAGWSLLTLAVVAIAAIRYAALRTLR